MIGGMSARMSALARSPLRRMSISYIKINSPFKRASKSPVNRSETTRIINVVKSDPTADTLRAQAEDCYPLVHELSHLAPPLQRFWSVSN